MLRNLVETVIQSNAEVAAEQEQALMVTTSHAKSQMEDLNQLAAETGASITELKESIVSEASRNTYSANNPASIIPSNHISK